MLELNQKTKIFKGENAYTRKVLLILGVALIVQLLFLPTHLEFFYEGFYWFGFYGLHFFYEYNTGKFHWWFFTGDLYHTIPVIPAIVIFFVLTIKLNKLERKAKLILGLVASFLFLLTLIIYPLMCLRYCVNCLNRFYLTSILIIVFYAIITSVITIHISRKIDKSPSRKLEGASSRDDKIKPSIILIRRIFMVLSLLLILQFFLPIFAYINFYTNPPFLYYAYIFLGVEISSNGPNAYLFGFDPLSLLQTIPIIAALVLLILLIVKFQTLERQTQLILGIASSCLLCLSQIFYLGIYFTVYGPIVPVRLLSCFNLHFVVISMVLILLGTIELSRVRKNDKLNDCEIFQGNI
ncbi:MAG: hypothetical protein JW891_07900 [Candidatus Lokiarchaeota archaeon]|nr:hypothetical protein [Candidatus Lokiarchaeota archaeon]